MRREVQCTEPKEWFQILAIFLASLSSLGSGMLFAWTSPSIPKIINDKLNYNITMEEASYFTVIPPIGMIFASWGVGKLSDHFGRKFTLMLFGIPQILAWVLISNATSIYVFYLARLFAGISDAFVYNVTTAYIGEIATPKVRGSWGNVMTSANYVGQLLINIIGSYFSISITGYVGLVVPCIFLCTFFFMPESPYFFLMHDKAEDARSSLQKLRLMENVEEELHILKSDVKRQMSESGSWKDLFCISTNRKALYASIFLRCSQQLSGIATFSVYTQYIFLKSGSSFSASTSAIIFGTLAASLNILAAFTLDRFGRRQSYFYSSLLCFLVLLMETTYFSIEKFQPETNLESMNWIPVAGMISFIICYSFGVGIVPTLMLGELFSSSIKSKALCFVSIIFALLLSSVTKLFQLLDSHFGLFAPFLFFSVCMLISLFLIRFFVPETKGKSLEEIQQSFKNNKSA